MMYGPSPIVPFIPFFIISIAFAIGNGYLAPRLRKNSLLWVILSLIPLVNFFFGIYVVYQVIFAVLDAVKRSDDVRAAAE